VQNNKPILRHPDTGKDLRSLRVPQWQTLLELACACADMTGLGYLGVDLVLDRRRGPMLLELNARPGLSIQLAKGGARLPRLRRVDALDQVAHWPIARRTASACRQFGVTDAAGPNAVSSAA